MRLVIVGVIPLFSILWIEAGERPERLASCWSDQPRSARALATFAPIAETVCSISEPKYCGVVDIDFRKGNVHHPKRRSQAISFLMVNIPAGPAGVGSPTYRRNHRRLRLTRPPAVG